MTTVKDDSTAAADEQLGSLSLGESAERKDTENEPTAKNGTPAKLSCSACGKSSDTLKECTACKCVWYCDKDCQNKHWKEHKKECRRIKKELDKRGGKLDIGTELDIGPLGESPPREECPICMRVLPTNVMLQTYMACCGKTICCGCDYQHQKKRPNDSSTCAFCRAAVPRSGEEILARARKRVELKDPIALFNLGMSYRSGQLGLPMDQAKCIDLLREAADLGLTTAQYQIGCFYDNGEMGLEQNKEEANKYWVKAAEGGHLISRHNAGVKVYENGDRVAAMCHWRICASAGFKSSIDYLIEDFESGLLRHEDLTKTLWSFYDARAEMKSEERDEFINHLKMTGEYEEQYDSL